MVPRPLPWFALVTMVLVTDSTSAGGGGTVLSTGAAVTSRAVANRTKASVGSGGSCATHVDCPAQQYCDDTFSCYQCSYLANRKANCDALAQDCCSAAFLRQCPGNPKGCADTCAAALEAACGADHHDVFACAQCSGIHQQQLQVAGCDNNAIAGWCASVGPGPAPAPVYNHYHCEGSQCKVGWARDHGANYTTDSCDGRCKGYACQYAQCIEDTRGEFGDETCDHSCHMYLCSGASCVQDDHRGSFTDCTRCHLFKCLNGRCVIDDVRGSFPDNTCDGNCQ